jgi:hypothetical protein
LSSRIFPRGRRRERSIKLSSHHDFNQIQFNAPLNPVLIGRPDALINYARPQFSRPSIGRQIYFLYYKARMQNSSSSFCYSALVALSRQWLALHYLSGIFGARGAEIYTSARRTIKFPYARARFK